MNHQLKKLLALIKDTKPPKWMMVVAVLLGIVETTMGLAVPLLTMEVINSFQDQGMSWSALLLVGLALLVQTAISGIAFYLMSAIGGKIVAGIRERVWSHVLRLRVAYFDKHESGETMSRITQDTNVIKELITQHFISFFTGLLTVVGSVAILLWIDWKMTLLMLIAVPLSIAVLLPLGSRMNQISLAHQDALAHFNGHLGRVLTNIRLVKAYQAEKVEDERGQSQIRSLYRIGLKEAKILSILSPVMTLVIMIVLIAIFGYGGAQVASGAITAGALVAIMFYLVQIVVPFTQMATFFTSVQKALGATERLHEMLEQPVEGGGETVLKAKQSELVFDQVDFRYEEKQIFNKLSLAIPHGKTTALVGTSGGGKTTIFSLIERFYDNHGGTIRYGDQPIEQIKLHEWRSLFGYVSQESPLTSGTIRDNVAYGDVAASEQDIIEALKKANAWEFISRLEHGIDTQVGEAGIKLSGGQRQRIAIARALLRDPKILLLDEATSNLDNESEAYVQEALKEAMKGRTTIIIAHRLSTVTHADQLIVLENGVITGRGTHQELMHGHDYYQKLVKRSAEAI
ncbi:ABC transporter ATP-binding protein [Paenibacillus septentrionalis]|uniref:ABC transporter ATP-binding protein n=1 Tax=Paenibacillus septentrionalis TaxID=429342 RepID=A0ABW1V3N1_9BACL